MKRIMKRKTRIIMIVGMLLLTAISTGCATNEKMAIQTEAKVDQAKLQPAEEGNQQEEPSAEESKGTKLLTDMAGRQVEVPVGIKKVYCTSPVGTIMLYTVSPNLLAGLNYEASAAEKEYLVTEFTELPVLGGWFGKGNTGNIEEIAKAKPDIIINAGTIVEDTVEFSDNLQNQLGIPVVYVKVDLLTMGESYKFLGDLLNMKERTDELAAYVTETLEDAEEKVAGIQETDKVRVYYAEGAQGLQTDPKGSSHTQVIDMLGGINVADVKATGGYGRAEVSVEQIIAWDPDLIIAGFDQGYTEDGAAYDYMQKDSVLKEIRAIKNGLIYEVPSVPFSWFDRPPSANTIIGIKWTANTLYPNIFDYDLRKAAKEFYQLFYRCELTEEQLDTLLNRGSR